MDHPRLLLHHFLSLDLCKELEFIHRSCGTVGYRPNVFSTTLSHLIATNCAHLVLPFVSIRECLKDKVEEFFGCEFELFIEFTGLISWCKGACIGWHSDDNRPYLKQRDFAVVCYLNSHGTNFKGGKFRFKDGEPSTIVPIAGDVLIYTADDRNIHSVEEVLDGERLTLTLWFTRNKAHDEDSKLLSLISEILSNREVADNPKPYLPLPASDSMYWFSRDQLGFDVRCARAHILGYNFYTTTNDKYNIPDLSDDSTGVLSKPLRLGREEIFEKEFINSLHALQVVQFYYWKSDESVTSRMEAENCTGSTEPFLLPKKSGMELDLPCNHQLAETVLGHLEDLPCNHQLAETVLGHLEDLPCNHQLAETVLGHISQGDSNLSFDWSEFTRAVAKWEEYSYSLHKDLLNLLPFWLPHQTMFFIDPI